MAEKPTPVTGAISFTDCKLAFRGSAGNAAIKMSQFYTQTNPLTKYSIQGGIPLSGTISISQLRGKGKGFVANIFSSPTSIPVGLYSVRHLLQQYNGPVLRIRRVSDNVEQDFYADQYGNAATSTGTTVAAFLTATTGRITTLYDQTGNGRHCTQTRVANQPLVELFDSNTKIMMNVNGAWFDGATALNSATTLPVDARYIFVTDANVSSLFHRGTASSGAQYEPYITGGGASHSGTAGTGNFVTYTLSTTRRNVLYVRTDDAGPGRECQLNGATVTVTTQVGDRVANPAGWPYGKPVLAARIADGPTGGIAGISSVNAYIYDVILALTTTPTEQNVLDYLNAEITFT